MNSRQVLEITDSLTERAENYGLGRMATRCALGAYDEISRQRTVTPQDLEKSWKAAYNWSAADSGSGSEAARNAYH